MKVRILLHISGTRNGVDWPAPGELLTVTDPEGADLVAAGIAEELEAPSPVRTATPPATAETRTRKSTKK